jgi:hypothetical protein
MAKSKAKPKPKPKVKRRTRMTEAAFAKSEVKSAPDKTLTFNELSSKLDKAVADVKQKKEVLDKALTSVEKANAEYGVAVLEATNAKTQLNEELAKVLP